MLAVFHVLENGLLFFFVPSDDVNKTSFIAQLAADAFGLIILDLVIGIDHRGILLVKND